MKVALVLDDSLDRPDGVQQYVLTIGAYLARVGHEVHYVCSSTTRQDLPHVHSLARNTSVRFNGNVLRIPLPTSRRHLRALLQRERFDVIHVQTPHSPMFAGRIVSEARRVQGSSVAIVGTFLILPTGLAARAGTRALGLLLRRNLRLFDRFCAISPAAVDFSRRAFRVHAEMIPAAVDVSAIASAVPKSSRKRRGPRVVIAFLGRLVDRKGAVELIEALALVDPAIRATLDVRVGGRGPLMDDMKRRIATHGLGMVVTMEGFLAEADKPRFLAEADLAVFPATGGESFGVVLVEAMASGAGAVLGGDNPGYRSVLGDSPDVIIDAENPRAFADHLERLASDPAARERIGADQRARVRQFDIAVVGPAIEAFYRAERVRG